MNLWFRTLLVYLFAHFRPKADVMDELRLPLRVWPTDIDVAVHMNNGRYLSLADLGRWDLMIRIGFWKTMRSNGWHPVVGASKIWHRRSLQPFQKFELTTQLLFWDEKWTYIEHRYEGVGKHAGTLYCRVVIKSLFLHGREKVPSADLISAFGYDGSSPPRDEALVAALA
ncbi:MAG: thioesterase family protein [Pseudomonadota bacterium]